MIRNLANKPTSSIQQIKEDAVKHEYTVLDWVNCNCDQCNKTLVQLRSPNHELYYACQCGRRAKYVDRGEGGPLIRP